MTQPQARRCQTSAGIYEGEMEDINGVPTSEYSGPTFSVNLHDRDGDVYCGGIYLHYGDTIIKVASTLRGFQAHAKCLVSMIDEIAENLNE